MKLRLNGMHDEELQRLVDRSGQSDPNDDDLPETGALLGQRKPPPRRPSLLDDDDLPEGEDEMYEQAVDLVRRLNKASVSLLQRRLRIGYTRAARMMMTISTR